MNLSTFMLCTGLISNLIKAEVLAFVPLDDQKCVYFRKDRMLKAKCTKMDLKEVPQFLSSSTELMDISYNRIRKLKSTSFQRYKSIKYLLLFENKIQIIEPGTFLHLSSLEEIDLSNNALITIPLELFNLPSLRNLYVDSNALFNLSRDLQRLEKPIKAPLEYLNIADCELHDIPNFGILPSLWHLNASLNPLDKISIENFSPLCYLKSIDLKGTNIPYCSCQLLQQFIEMQKIKTSYKFDCDITKKTTCPDATNETFYTEEYDYCNSFILSKKAKSTWIIISGVIAALFFIVLVILYYFCAKHKGNERKISKKQGKKHQEPLMNPS